jgi:hypothetical protein
MTRTRQQLGDDAGVAMVEFALIVPILLVVLFGMVDFGRAFNYWNNETHLANQAARYAAVNFNPSTSGQTLQQYIQSLGTTAELRNGSESIAEKLKICIDFPSGVKTVGQPVRVRATARYSWLSVLGSLGTPLVDANLTGQATMRLEAVPTKYSEGCSG